MKLETASPIPAGKPSGAMAFGFTVGSEFGYIEASSNAQRVTDAVVHAASVAMPAPA
jgi:hypothetical protein